MLNFQLQQFPFRLGLAEGVDPHQAPPGTLTTAENAVWKASGRVEKRFGVTALTSSILGGGSLSAAARIFTRGSELCATDGTTLYAYSPAASLWVGVGAVPDVGVTWEPLLDPATGVQSIDQALSGSSLATAWVVGTSNVFVQVTDLTTGTMLLAPISVTASGVLVRAFFLGTVLHVLTRSGANMKASAYDSTAGYALLVQSNLRTDADVNCGWDAMVIGSTIVIAYQNSPGNLLKLYSYTYAAGVYTQAATGGITGEAGSGFRNVAIDGAAGEVLYVLYTRSSPDVSCRIATADPSTMAQVTAPVTLMTSGVGDAGTYSSHVNVAVKRTGSTTALACWSTGPFSFGGATQGYRAASIPVSSTLTLVTTAKRGTWGAAWAGKPFLLGSKYYALVTDYGYQVFSFSSALSTMLVEVETTDYAAASVWVPHRMVGKTDVLIGGDFNFNTGLPNAVSVSSTQVLAACPFQSVAAPTPSLFRNGIKQVSFTTGTGRPVDLWRSSFVGKEAYVSGSLLGAYDGRLLFDYGMTRCSPIEPLVTGAGSMAAGNYLYGMVPEYRSAVGMLHRGPTFADPNIYTVAASGAVSIAFPSIATQTKQTSANHGYLANGNAVPVRLALYRSTAGGSTLQRLTVDPIDAQITDSALATSQTYNDTVGDSSISTTLAGNITLASRPAIYTAGGILDDYAPPASVTMFHHADRLWVLAGDQRTWWYSKAFQDDAGTAPGFNASFRVVFDDVQTAGATMDDKAIFFSATGIRYMLGLGPAPDGTGSDFSTPLVIQSDVGCTNARSVVGTPDGVMFLSDRGIYLLSRGLETSWIGRPVKDTLAAYPVVTSAVLVAKQNQVRFTCNNAGGTAGVVLVYDYVERQWSTSRYTVGGVYGAPIADACMWNGAWTFVTPAGAVLTESSSTYLDAGVYVPMTLETAWISAAGPLSFQSVRSMNLHGKSRTDHDLTIQAGFESATAYQQTLTFAATTPVTAVGDLEECEMVIGTRRKCSLIRFKISDATPSAGTVGTGQGPSFDMIGLEVGIKRGFGNNPATKKG